MRRLALAALALALAGPVAAHPMPNSVLVVQTQAGLVELSASIPLSELGAMGDVPASEAGRYIARHAVVTGADGRLWPSEVRETRPGERDGHQTVDAILRFTAPPGGSDRAAMLRYDAVTHSVASHYVLVYRKVGEALAPLGRLQSPATELKLP